MNKWLNARAHAASRKASRWSWGLGTAVTLALMLTAGCASGKLDYRDLEQQKLPRIRSGDTLVSVAELREDLRLLRYALERGYVRPGFIDARTFQTTLLLLRSLGELEVPLSVARFCDSIDNQLSRLGDGHLGAWRRDDRSRCGDRLPRKATVGRRRHADDPQPGHVELLGDEHLGVVSIGRFASRDDASWKQLFTSLDATLGVASNLVVDLRGNHGGDDLPAFALAERLMGAPVALRSVLSVVSNTPEAATLFLNYCAYDRDDDGRLPPTEEALCQQMAKYREALLAHPGEPKWSATPHDPVAVALGERAFRGRIAILIDAECASACESALELLRQHPRARVFGQNTAGAFHTGTSGAITLPNSGIVVRIPLRYEHYPDGRSFDRVGFAPDVPVGDGADAFDTARAWLAKPAP